MSDNVADSINPYARYLVAAIKSNDNEETSIAFIEDELKKLVNSNLDATIAIVKAQENEWGETAVMVKRITKDVVKQIESRKL